MPIPEINENEVLVRVTVCGVCTSELATWKNGIGAGKFVMGHEPVGIIEAKGRNVKGFEVGDRVTGLMWECFAEYTKADYRNIIKVPDSFDDIEAIAEPISCLVSGAERTPVSIGQTVAVVGTGYMGLGFMQLMKLKGAGKIIAIDKRKEALENALKFGADEALFPKEAAEKYAIVEWDQMDKGRDIPVVAEATGKPEGLELAGNLTGVHGFLSVVGYHQNGNRSINMELWNWKAFSMINAHERRFDVHVKCMKQGFTMIEKGLFRAKEMVTHEFRLDEVDKAYKNLVSKENNFIKAYIRL
jgi:threonine dehydrogenase-like Zn-dependent dehydrogenase